MDKNSRKGSRRCRENLEVSLDAPKKPYSKARRAVMDESAHIKPPDQLAEGYAWSASPPLLVQDFRKRLVVFTRDSWNLVEVRRGSLIPLTGH